MLKFLCKAESFDEKQKLIKLLDENSIKYKVKTTGPNIFQRAGYENKCFWFKLYVNKSDYQKALSLLNNK